MTLRYLPVALNIQKIGGNHSFTERKREHPIFLSKVSTGIVLMKKIVMERDRSIELMKNSFLGQAT